jgi:EmrB/QacA subfamily drug resistance transporter
MAEHSFRGRSGALVLITAVELLVFLDTSVVNIALPRIGAGLHLREAGLSWVTNAYLLAFGGCMLAGGRAADCFGARRMFRIGLALFTPASAAAGLAVAPWQLIAARALQGVGGAVLIPAQLALLTLTFTDPDARRRAFGVWSAMGAAGAAIGTSAGGLLTQALGWQAIFLINVPIGAAALVVSPRLLPADQSHNGGEAVRLDLPGAVVGTAGLLTLGYAVGALADPGTRGAAEGLLAVAVLLLAGFAVIESRARDPLVPLRLFGVREVTGSALVNALVGAAHVPAFALLALYLQQTQHYGPNRSGLAVLPVAAGALLASRTVVPGLLKQLGARQTLAIGLGLQAAGLAWFAGLPSTLDYVTDVLPAALLLGIGLPAAFVGVTAPAVTAVAPADAGVTAGLVNTAQRIGSGLGVTVVLVLAAALTGPGTPATNPAYLTGLRAGFAVCAVLALLGLLLTLVLLRPDPSKAATTPAAAKGPSR